MLAETAAERVRRKIAQLRAKLDEPSRLSHDLAEACHALGAHVPYEPSTETFVASNSTPERR